MLLRYSAQAHSSKRAVRGPSCSAKSLAAHECAVVTQSVLGDDIITPAVIEVSLSDSSLEGNAVRDITDDVLRSGCFCVPLPNKTVFAHQPWLLDNLNCSIGCTHPETQQWRDISRLRRLPHFVTTKRTSRSTWTIVATCLM